MDGLGREVVVTAGGGGRGGGGGGRVGDVGEAETWALCIMEAHRHTPTHTREPSVTLYGMWFGLFRYNASHSCMIAIDFFIFWKKIRATRPR
jgi:hypothetical protein